MRMMSLSFGSEKEKRNGGMILLLTRVAFIKRPTKILLRSLLVHSGMDT
jgi:hypothetical protein